MAADRWSECPSCLARPKKATKDANEKLYESYGKVTLAEFNDMRDALPVLTRSSNTVRENWWVDFLGDEVHFKYSANCTVCEFSADINQRWPFKDDAR
jgi:hypothetical protein